MTAEKVYAYYPGCTLHSSAKEYDASARLVCQALGIKGGLSMRMFGPSERYCYKEAVFLKLVPAGNQRRLISGAELLAVFDRCSRYQDEQKKKESGDGSDD